jgi:predicted PP-loop superfamily ATPase
MSVPKGQKFGGRGKGSLNKSTIELKAAIAAACGEDWDPVVAMALIAKKGTIPTFDPLADDYIQISVSEKTRQSCLKEVSEYMHCKRRAVEVSGVDGDPIEMITHNDDRAEETLLAMRVALETE